MSLTEFLLARITEDEAAAQRAWDRRPVAATWTGPQLRAGMAETDLLRRFPPARILADCKAKRRIIAQYKFTAQPRGLVDRLTFPTAHAALGIALGDLALPYTDHPDYREEWGAR